MPDLSIIVPVYNEAATIDALLNKLVKLIVTKEILIVNDGSDDGTVDLLNNFRSKPEITILEHERNLGKGMSIRTALKYAQGDFVVIQDGDLEYDPADLLKMLESAKRNNAVIYGSRNLGHNDKSSKRFYHGGRFLSELTSFLYGTRITDESTCYKMFPRKLIQSIPLNCKGFEFCPEITAKILQNGIRIKEIPVYYNPRNHENGKKIKWTDGFTAIWILLKLKLFEIFEIIHLPWRR